MILEPVIAVVVAITVLMIIFRIFFKPAFKVVSIIWFVFFLATVAFGILAYADIKDMQERCPEMPPVFLLEDGGSILAGINMKIEEGNGGLSGDDVFISDLSRFQQAYDNDDFSAITEKEHCKAAVFRLQTFEFIESINLTEGISISKSTIWDVLRSDSPVQELAEDNVEVEGIESVETQIKGFIFATMFAKALEQKGASFATSNLKNGNIKVYKETITFKVLKHAPVSLMDELTSRLQ